MKSIKLDELRLKINKGIIPTDFPEFGGANLVITTNNNKIYSDEIIVVQTEHASALSWLVSELKEIYNSEINYLNKYEFYPSIGSLINRTLLNQGQIFEVMLNIIDEIEKDWGEK
jgi:hypothetical protein